MAFALWQSLLILVVGAVVGSACTYLAQSRRDLRTWERERDARWEVLRKEAYARYGSAVKRVIMLATRLGDHRILGIAFEPLSVEQIQAQLSDAQIARAEVWEEIQLLGDRDTIAAARIWHRSSWVLDKLARGNKSREEAWVAAKAEAKNARDEFLRAARADLGVRGVLPASADDPDSWMPDAGPESL